MLSQLSVGVFMWQTLLPTCLQEQREECVHVLGENIHLMPLMEIIDSLILMQHFVLVLWCSTVFVPPMVLNTFWLFQLHMKS